MSNTICELFIDIDTGSCAECGHMKVDHNPLTELQLVSFWVAGRIELSEVQAKAHVESLVTAVGALQVKAIEWHADYRDAIGTENATPGCAIDTFDDAGHEIDSIIIDTTGDLVPGTGGAWGLSLNEAPIRSYPNRTLTMAAARNLRLQGEHVDIYAEIYTDGKQSWEKQAH